MKRLFILAICTSMLYACSLPSPYKFQPGESSASIDVKHVPWPVEMCVDGHIHPLEQNKDRLALVPVGRRVTILGTYEEGGYRSKWVCRAGRSFVPKEGMKYFGNFESKDQHCRVEVYKQDAGNRTGLMLESTIGPADCLLK
jgi:hypothetical protein